MAAKKPGRAESGETADTTEATAAGAADEGAKPGRGRSGGPAKKSRSAANGAGAGAQPSGGEAGGDATTGGDAADGTQARTRTARKQAGASADTQGGAGGTTRGRKSASAGATKTATKRGGGVQGRGAQGRGAQGASAEQGGGSEGSDLQRNLRAFVEHHPHGWQHNDWEGLLHHLRESGIDTGNTEQIGSSLEKERVVHTLERGGIAGAKARSVADRFGSIHQLRNASADQIAEVKGINRSQAEKIQQALQG